MIEYRVIFLTPSTHEATVAMNALAADGWRFVSRIGSDRSMGVLMARSDEQSKEWPIFYPPPAPYVPGTALMTDLDEHHVQSWHALKQSGGRLTHMLDRFRHNAPMVFEHLCQTDTEAARIAVQSGWQVGPLPERTDADVERAQQSAAAAIAAIHRSKLP